MPTDTPTDRAALEALAEQWRLARGATPSSNHEYINGLLDAGGRLAATLRALASRAEPPADVAALVEEARALYHEWRGRTLSTWPLSERTPSIDALVSGDRLADLVNRLAAALTAQAERIAELEGKHADGVRELSRALQEKDRLVMQSTARAETAEAMLKEAQSVVEPFARAGLLFEPRGDGWDMVVYAPAAGDEYKIFGDDLRAARALAAKLKGEG